MRGKRFLGGAAVRAVMVQGCDADDERRAEDFIRTSENKQIATYSAGFTGRYVSEVGRHPSMHNLPVNG